MNAENSFDIYPAIDLRQGQVVRLVQGDPKRQTVYAQEGSQAALRWLQAGARWLHVVNLDGAFENEAASLQNRRAVNSILPLAARFEARVQLGGGLRTLQAVKDALSAGVSRVVLGTAAISDPQLVASALQRFGSECVAVALDARQGQALLRGWQSQSGLQVHELAQQLARQGLRILIYTDVECDGTGAGVNWPAAQQIAQASGMQVIASGGVNSLKDIQQVRQARLAGVIIGSALYQGTLRLEEALAIP
ncbi:MAG: 1-(5-phosphoribosyl)-5-[(5-phosphoribosylamino)methylideneamino]imidazole-4-carboxamide isomerase [Anaerolineales bacterium]|nr:1-(5-phosphoribosyl)-5-[(5-phosphoribosylamino)methylideneamino]imidazole-4-carboxamide isomerase [Anaerolineales bacterium]